MIENTISDAVFEHANPNATNQNCMIGIKRNEDRTYSLVIDYRADEAEPVHLEVIIAPQFTTSHPPLYRTVGFKNC